MKLMLGCLLASTLTCTTADAQSDWTHSLLIYVLGAGIDGNAQIGSLEANIDQSFDDILEHLEAGVMGSYRATNGSWAHTIDSIYIGLRGENVLASGARIGAEIDQLIASYDAGYQFREHFYLLAGVRYNSIEANLLASPPSGTVRGSGEKDWLDPYVGISSTLPFNDTFALVLRADVGGFDVGSKLTWQAIARLDCRFGGTFFGTVGYRILDTDYEDGSGTRYFRYDMTTSGPAIGFGWVFQ